MRRIAALLLMLPLLAAAQKRPPAKAAASTPLPIESIRVEGNANYSDAQILRAAGLHAGQLATPKDFEAATNRLTATGAFEKIDFRFSPAPGTRGYAVVFQVVEAGPFFPVRFEDLSASNEELMKALAGADPMFAPKIPATQPVLARYARAIEAYLSGRGHSEKVAGKLMPDSNGELSVLFRPAATPPSVAFVKFTGNQVLPATTLSNTMLPVAVGAPYREKSFRELLDANIRPLYDARGRVRVSFPEIQTQKAADVNGLVVTVKVDEGPSFDLGQVRSEGSGLASEEVNKVGGFKTGDIFNAEQIRAGAQRVEAALRHDGYMKVKTRIDRQVNDKTKTVNVMLHFDRGPQYTFGKLTIEGLDIQTEPAIRKMWALKEGKPFNADYPDYFLNRLREDGVFEKLGKTKAVITPHDEEKTVDVTLVFSPLPPEKPAPKRPY